MAENEIENTIKKNKKEAETNENINKKKKITIMGLSVWRIMAYFVIYSVVGYIIETISVLLLKEFGRADKAFYMAHFVQYMGLELA